MVHSFSKTSIAESQFSLGVMYFKGWDGGVIKDIVYAHMWVNISASNEDKNEKKLKIYFLM